MRKGFVVTFVILIAWMGSGLFGQEQRSVQIEINAPRLTVFDIASQVLAQKGYSLTNTNERIGLINTDYRDAKESFGSSLLLSLMGRKDVEIMITTSIMEANGKCVLRLFPKARMKKVNRLNISTFEEFELNQKGVDKFFPLAQEIKSLAEQSSGAPVPAPAAPAQAEAPKPETIKTTSVAAPAAETPPSPAIIEIPFIRIKVAAANIRQSASLQGAIAKRAAQGEEYKVIGLEGDWYEILFNDASAGYVNRAVCEPFTKTEKRVPAAASPSLAPVAAAAPAPAVKETPAIISSPESSSSQPAETSADKSFLFGVAGAFSLGMGDLADDFGIGFGIDVHALIRVFNHLYVGGYLGASMHPGGERESFVRILPMLEAQYRFPVGKRLKIIGGVGMGLAVDIWEVWGWSETDLGFTVDLTTGIQYGILYFGPRIRLVSYDGDSYGTFDFPIGIVF